MGKGKSNVGQFLHYTVSNTIGMVGLSLYILADTFFISKGLGANGLAALNLALPIYNAVHGAGLMLGMGGATKYSIVKSQGDHERGDRAFSHTLYLMAALSMFFVLLGLFANRQLAALLGANGEVFEMTRIYLRVILLFSPAFILNEIFLGFVRNDGNPNLASICMLCGSLFNIVFDYIFIFPMGMGMFGAVLATGISPVVSITLILVFYCRKGKQGFHFLLEKPRPNILRKITSLGIPSFITEMCTGIVILVFNRLMLGLEGNAGVAAYGVVVNISYVMVAMYTGLAQGVQPLISHAYGQGRKRDEREFFRYSAAVAGVLALLIFAVIGCFADPIASVFNSENQAVLQEIAVEGQRLYFSAALFTGGNILLAVYFTAVNRPLPAQLISLLRGIVVIVPAAVLFSKIWGVKGLWISYPATEGAVLAVGATFYIKRLLSEKREKQTGEKRGKKSKRN